MATLRALEAPLSRLDDAPAALRAERLRRRDQVMEPVTAAFADQRVFIEVTLPEAIVMEGVHCELIAENGSTVTIPSSCLIRVGSWQRMTEYRLELAGPGLPRLEAGYYELTLEYGGRKAAGMLVIAPPCPLPARSWGAFLPAQSFRSDGNLGVGSYPELSEVSRWITGLGGAFLGTLPLFPTFLDTLYEPSPYLPVTRLGWHEAFIDPRAVPEWSSSSSFRNDSATPLVTTRLEELRASNQVDYRGVEAVVRQLLGPMAKSVFATPSPRRQGLMEFARSRPELVAYAWYRSQHDQGRPPPRIAEAVSAVDPEGLDDLGEFHLYAQWVAEQQLRASTGRLYLDLPVGVHPDGFDAWWEADSFADGIQVGAPPDAFFASGQAWGFRPLHPRRVRDDRYHYPIACLRQVMRHAAVVRIDHVMGLHRLFWVPDGGGPDRGTYVRYHLDEMIAIVALEAHRAECAVVGEDLGTVPDVVRQAMGPAQVLRSWVLQFEASPDDPLPDPPEQAMATLGTHDLPRFAPFWEGDDIDEAVAIGAQGEGWADAERRRRREWKEALAGVSQESLVATPAGALQACVDHLAEGPALLTMIDLEDLWLEHRRINRPGSAPGDGSWTERMARTLETMQSDAAVVELLADVGTRRRGRVGAGEASLDRSVPGWAESPATVEQDDRRAQ